MCGGLSLMSQSRRAIIYLHTFNLAKVLDISQYCSCFLSIFINTDKCRWQVLKKD